MFKSTEEFDAAVYEMLVRIRDGSNYKELKEKYGQENYEDALEHSINRGYIKGITAQRAAAGNLVYGGTPRLTHSGLSFIENRE